MNLPSRESACPTPRRLFRCFGAHGREYIIDSRLGGEYVEVRACSGSSSPAVKWAFPFRCCGGGAAHLGFFRRTWRELDEEALVLRRELHERGEIDYRPVVALMLGALVLTFQEYYGRSTSTSTHPRRARRAGERAPGQLIDIETYDELYRRGWWGLTRVAGYLLPLAVWPLFFRKDKLLDMGLRVRGFREHAWLYALFVTVMVPVMLLVGRQPDFVDYYPIYNWPAARGSTSSCGR